MRIYQLLFIALSSVSCASGWGYLMLEAPVISTSRSVPPSTALKAGRPFQTQWCEGEATFTTEAPVGNAVLFHTLKKAYAETKADYFLNVRILMTQSDGASCGSIEGFLPAPH